MLACGQADGRIVMRDPRSLKAEHTITAHTNGLSALEVQGNYLLSIGYTVRYVTTPLLPRKMASTKYDSFRSGKAYLS